MEKLNRRRRRCSRRARRIEVTVSISDRIKIRRLLRMMLKFQIFCNNSMFLTDLKLFERTRSKTVLYYVFE